jgi:uncharacterized protein YggU (UPF0235/DUF167 family)
LRLIVRVTPRGGRDAIDGWTWDEAGRPVLRLRVAAAAADGAANAAVLALLAKALGRPKSALRLLRGETARVKQIEVDGLDEAAVHARLGPPPAAPSAQA